jgi:type IV pilus assembly protein PilE
MRQCQRGVTLIELMVVMVIISILAAIAYPSYRQQVLRSSRSEARSVLLQAAQALEKCFTRFAAYNNPDCVAANNLGSITGIFSAEGLYQVSFDSILPNAYTLRAVPKGGQIADTECGAFTLTETGLRGVAGPGGAQKCW